jgi:hypothetical protein
MFTVDPINTHLLSKQIYRHLYNLMPFLTSCPWQVALNQLATIFSCFFVLLQLTTHTLSLSLSLS